MSSSYLCIASGACAYDKANDIKGTVVATFESQQIISADEYRAQAGRRWLHLKIQGRSTFSHAFFLVTGGLWASLCFCAHGPDAYTPWVDVEGRPLWASSADAPLVSVSTPLMGVNATAETQDTTRCTMQGCNNNAQFKCHFCKKIVCLHHHSRVGYFKSWINTCPLCAHKVTNHRIFFALCLFAVIGAIVAVSIYLAHREIQ
ncbi:hypothetical protein pmac_cds_862 [Pandoravirus macleodensis]|uniref:Uncharacterized protein n=1 Tax=Pandoravirus macleodensis TaxID=2107707 RepID=A0A2U7UGN8_9VIRU|nr:hypothetical protein pmac_cds_862 [Pandoravirus macleodensis]AVK77550.1 hypothetical protein pmac_cds_862 [Pandoravirus macleodensis]